MENERTTTRDRIAKSKIVSAGEIEVGVLTYITGACNTSSCGMHNSQIVHGKHMALLSGLREVLASLLVVLLNPTAVEIQLSQLDLTIGVPA